MTLRVWPAVPVALALLLISASVKAQRTGSARPRAAGHGAMTGASADVAAQAPQGGLAPTEASQAAERLRRAWSEFIVERKRDEAAGRSPSLVAQARPDLAPQKLELAIRSETTFIQPDVITSNNGELSATLKVEYAKNRIGGDPVWLRNYNGKLVGPTLVAKPGDTLLIKFQNRLPPEPPLPPAHNVFHGWNTTNLHTHGLHVSPAGNSDNVLLELAPGQDFGFEIKIPSDHPPGTFWYHAHKHGAVAAQVSSGISGALIRDAGQRIFVFQQVPYIVEPKTGVGVVELEYADKEFGPGTWDALGRYTTINGVVLPVIDIAPGAVERWRFVHSGVRETILAKVMKLAAGGILTPGFPLHEIAVDGLALGKIVPRPQVELEPGYRSDVLVKAPDTPGEYVLVDEAIGANKALLNAPEPRKFLARIRVRGPRHDMRLPESAELKPLKPLKSITDGELTGTQTTVYNIETSPTLRFTIDGREYDPTFARKLTLGRVEEWTIRGFVANHPFHIHVNPFEVISIKDKDGVETLEEPLWRDTILMPSGGTVKFRTRYQVYIGRFVQHCHILDHEDLGMMELVEIGL
jgi:FtsP/CotA-like multicopper oxidase with cupredoxin domain